MTIIQILAFTLITILAQSLYAKGGGGHASPSHTYHAAKSATSKSAKCASCARDAKGRIARSKAAVKAFKKANPCPSGGHGSCKGYVIDHVVPLKRGGADSPENMAWQTVADAKAKDKTE